MSNPENTNITPLPAGKHIPAQASIKPAYLTQIGRNGVVQSIPLVHPMLTIGSDPACVVRLRDASIQARHARIEIRGETWTIRDLQSVHGVFVNDSRVSEATLNDFDRVRIGEVVFLFRRGEINQNELSSKNPSWQSELAKMPSLATTDYPVLLIGPSGSGKEILAKTLHESSRRRQSEFVTINCSALSENLIESELFGHMKGSFTGATHDRKGAFETARGGTIFLDEIGDLPLSLQPKLLRALENNEIRPVGSDRAIETDVRVVAATHKDLASLVQQGRFREDLYWRLNVCSIHPPALRERMEDFTDLVYHFCKKMRVRLSHGAIEALRAHDWPGNIRELKNVVSRAAAYFPGHYVQAEDVQSLIDRRLAKVPELFQPIPGRQAVTNAGGSVMREIEREMIIRRLVANHGNQRQTAIDLGMPKSTLHDRLKVYSIDVEEIRKLA